MCFTCEVTGRITSSILAIGHYQQPLKRGHLDNPATSTGSKGVRIKGAPLYLLVVSISGIELHVKAGLSSL